MYSESDKENDEVAVESDGDRASQSQRRLRLVWFVCPAPSCTNLKLSVIVASSATTSCTSSQPMP